MTLERPAQKSTHAEYVHLADLIPDDADSNVAAGLVMMEQMDKARWGLGDLALRMMNEARYGEGGLRWFANQIGAKEKTLYGYAKVAAYYPPFARGYYWWSAYRAAMPLEDVGASLMVLRKALLRMWTVGTVEYVVARLLRKQRKVSVVIGNFHARARALPDGRIVLIPKAGALAPQFHDGDTYEIRVYRLR
ncbi:MAG: hypothetical protein SF123_19690 [Chloroflexota bacterium]|nr:hypothetical protein [Chloroflexota bacterium]